MNHVIKTHRTVQSHDGTSIAYERFGSGPTVILVGGAFCDRLTANTGTALAQRLSDAFTTIAYDRRGRGDSTDRAEAPALAREIEDLASLIETVGTPAHLFGISSGGALVIEAALAGLPVASIAVYEVPYAMTEEREENSRVYALELGGLLKEGRPDAAAKLFMRTAGMPDEMLRGVEQMPYWGGLKAMAPTLVYDALALRSAEGGRIPEEVETLAIPALVAIGSDSPLLLTEPGRALAGMLPDARLEVLAGQTHNVAVDALEPLLRAFFGKTAGV